MSDFYSELEANLVKMLKASAALDSIKTFEADVRECLFSGDKLTQGFRPDELPAVNVTAELSPAKQSPFTVSEVLWTVPVSIIAIARGQRKKDARAKVREIQVAIENVVNAARKSDNGLGGNAIVSGDISSTVVIVQEKPYHFAIGETQFQILKVVQL
jgi:hypothetical protein